MKAIRDAKISTKLVGSFLLMTVSTAILGGVGYIHLRSAQAAHRKLYEEQLIPATELAEARSLYEQNHSTLKELASSADETERNRLETTIRENSQRIQDLIGKYRETINDHERDLLESLSQARSNYNAVRDRVIDLSKSNRQQEAQRLLREQTEPLAQAERAAFVRLIDEKSKVAKAQVEQDAQEEESTDATFVKHTLVSVLLALLLSWMLGRLIVRPVRELATAAQKLAKGDLDVAVPAGGADELGVLAESFRDMVENLKKHSLVAQKIGEGDLSARASIASERDTLGRSLEKSLAVLNQLMDDMARMSKAHDAGDIDVTIDASHFQGDFRKVAQGINDMAAGHMTVNKKAMACFAEFGKGNFGAELEKFPGKKTYINETVEQVRANLQALIVDTSMLVRAAMEGQLDARADASHHQGDFRKIVEGINETLETIVQPLRRFALVLDELAAGNFTVEVNENYRGEFDKLKRSINMLSVHVRQAMQQIGRSTTALVASAEQLNRVSQQMGASADETAAQANVVSAASEQVSKNIQTVATGSDEMGASIKEIAKNTADATKVALSAVQTAETTNKTIGQLGQSSAEIGQVIKVITSIAQQTNLLALNATIEAARAGEAGKGFAVVANEVKELAKETAKATEDISRKIEAIQGDTKGAVAAIAEITEVIHQISDIQNTIASAVEEQSVTTNEISRNLAEAAKGGVDITRNITGVAEAAQQTTTGAIETQKSAQSLERMAAELQELVSQFRYEDAAGAPVMKAAAAAASARGGRTNGNGKYAASLPDSVFADAVH